jgi:hypothetical protein
LSPERAFRALALAAVYVTEGVHVQFPMNAWLTSTLARSSAI